jgi:hypothetical protein
VFRCGVVSQLRFVNHKNSAWCQDVFLFRFRSMDTAQFTSTATYWMVMARPCEELEIHEKSGGIPTHSLRSSCRNGDSCLLRCRGYGRRVTALRTVKTHKFSQYSKWNVRYACFVEGRVSAWKKGHISVVRCFCLYL